MHSCAVGFVFNPDLGVCDEPQNVPKWYVHNFVHVHNFYCIIGANNFFVLFSANYYPKSVLDAIEVLKNFDNRLLA